MVRRIAAIQSNYIPWKGYFDIINYVDLFILYDHCQYTKNDWRNRNLIKTGQGLKWLTVPVTLENRLKTPINRVKVQGELWRSKHWKSIVQNYSRARYFEAYAPVFEELYLKDRQRNLSEINLAFIHAVNRILGIETRIRFSHEFDLPAGRTEKLLELCTISGAKEYVTGPSAKNYLDTKLFEKNNISISWFDYSGYPEYYQFFPPFEHGVSILDLIFHTGPEARRYLKSFRTEANTG